MNYELHANAKRELGEILNHQLELSQRLGDSELDKKIHHAKDALSTDSFSVLVMGEFSSGKSTFLNALLGDKIFPSSALACTGCIAEIQYSDNWTFTLIPKDKDEEAFTIERSQLKEYTSIDHNDSKHNPYEKLLVSAPMPLCKHGVKLIDSPGLNDPTSHDKTTLEYMPQVDAAIFCMDGQRANSQSDGKAIELMRKCGHDSIIYVVNKIDVVEQSEDYNKEALDNFYSHIRKKLVPRTSLGKDGIFFLNSKGALKAKMEGDAAMLRESRLPIFEKALEKILAGEKGRIKLGKICSMIALVNSDSSSKLRAMVENRRSNRKKLTAKLKESQHPLIEANKAADRIRGKIEEGVMDICERAKITAGTYHLSLREKLESWADIFIVSPNTPDDIKKMFKDEMMLNMVEWFQSDIVGMIKKRIKALQKNLDDEVEIFVGSISKLDGMFEPTDIPPIDDDIAGTDWDSIINGSLYSIAFGSLGLLIMGPLGLLLSPLGYLIDLFWGSDKYDKAREEFKSSLPEKLNESKQQFIENIEKTVREKLSAWQSTVNEKLEDKIKDVEFNVKDVEKSLMQDDERLSKEGEEFASLLNENDHIGQVLKDFRIKYKISAQEQISV